MRKATEIKYKGKTQKTTRIRQNSEQNNIFLLTIMCHSLLLPVSPAPAAPNREAMIAMPVAEPRAAAPPAPITALAPAATKGAASPPVTPGKGTSNTDSAGKKNLFSAKTYKVKHFKEKLSVKKKRLL